MSTRRRSLPYITDTLRDLLTMFQQTRSSRPAAKLETVSGHHPTGGVLDPKILNSFGRPLTTSDPPGHGNTGDWYSRAGRGQIILATNRNGGMLRLIAPRPDDDDVYGSNCSSARCPTDHLSSVRSCTVCCPQLYLSPVIQVAGTTGMPIWPFLPRDALVHCA